MQINGNPGAMLHPRELENLAYAFVSTYEVSRCATSTKASTFIAGVPYIIM